MRLSIFVDFDDIPVKRNRQISKTCSQLDDEIGSLFVDFGTPPYPHMRKQA